MANKAYYSVRTGKNPNSKQIELPILLQLFKDLYLNLVEEGYFQEAFGYPCVDVVHVSGSLGTSVATQMLRYLRKDGLWPIEQNCLNYSEDDIFDVIEFLYDYISKPIDGWEHTWNRCGWHYTKFDQNEGRQRFQAEINGILRDYQSGYELVSTGEILSLPEKGLETLLGAPVPSHDTENIESHIENAVQKFRRHRSSESDRRDAIRDLADVLEFLRPQVKSVLTRADESDLFNLANNFGIRHHNEEQKNQYDKPIWYSWMFYYYLATIHAALRLIEKANITK